MFSPQVPAQVQERNDEMLHRRQHGKTNTPQHDEARSWFRLFDNDQFVPRSYRTRNNNTFARRSSICNARVCVWRID